VTGQAISMKQSQATLRVYQRTIAMSVLLASGMVLDSILNPGDFRQNIVWATASAAATGLVSWLAPPWRIIAAAAVVFPLNVYTGVKFETDPVALANGLTESIILTWLLPYLDPAISFWHWASKGKSNLIVRLKQSVIFCSYGLWLSAVMDVVYALARIAAQSGGMIAGYPASDNDATYLIERVGAVAAFGSAAILLLVLVLGVPLWRRMRGRDELPEARGEGAPLPDAVAGAVSDTIGGQQ